MRQFLISAAGLLLGTVPLIAQNTSGSITGIVQDSSRTAISGARVVLLNQDQGVEARRTITNEAGIYLFSALQPATYTVTVELPGFNTHKQTDVRLFVNQRLGLPDIILEAGSQTESVRVETEAVNLESLSAERSGVVSSRQMVDIALNGRNFTGLLRAVPGAPADTVGGTATFNGQRNTQNNFIVDGQTVIDSGVNQLFAYRLNIDAIAEFKVSTNAQSAEFGRNSGAQIQVATRSGTHDFHGDGYFFKRHEGWNANSFDNNRRNQPRQLYRSMTAGYSIGGPAYIPASFNTNKNKLFFFVSHEWTRQKVPALPRRITVPTSAERQGDFSNTRDGAGIPVIIRDPQTGQPFSGNRIPIERFSPYGPSVLNWLPLPNIVGNPQYNYESQVPSELPSFDQVYRFDYNISSRWTTYFRIINSRQRTNNPYGGGGNNLGLSPIYSPTFGWSINGNVTSIISPTITNEFQLGQTKNGIPVDAPPKDSPYYRANSHITIPLLYPNADPIAMIPNFGFGGVPNSDQLTNFSGLPFANKNPITNVTDNFTKIGSKHTLKFGIFLERAVKSENPFRPVNSTIRFDRDSQNPNDTGWAFANALLGEFREYLQFSKTLLPVMPYWNIEWYGQDTWTWKRKLALTYGLRMNLVKPLYEKNSLFTNFDPASYDPAKRVAIYQPALVNGQRRARNPITGEVGPAVFIGGIVPGSGSLSNGLVHAGQNGVPKSLIENRGIQWGPRFGLVYTVNGKTVIRSGGGIFYDRIATVAIGYTNNFLTNPPGVQLSQIFYSNLAAIASSAGTPFPLQIVQLSRDGHVPTVYNFSVGMQRELPMHMLLDVSYVGTQSRHLVENRPFNAVPFGSAWLPENQDPALGRPITSDGTTTLPVNLYRPYTGYAGGNTVATGPSSAIAHFTFGGSANYNALQISLNRRVGRLQLGSNYTWSRALGTTSGHLTNTRLVNYGLLTLDRSHGFTFNYIYEIPSLARPGSVFDKLVARQFFSGWQLTGLTSMSVGAPLTLDYTLTGIGNAERNRRITGSEDVAPRVVFTCNPNLSRGKRTILAFINTTCVAPASKGSIGNDSGINSVRGPGIHQWDVSLFRKFQYGESAQRFVQVRLEMYNAFNHTQWATFNSVAQFTPTTGQLVNAAGPTNRDGFGALTTTRANSQRIIQLAAKVYF